MKKIIITILLVVLCLGIVGGGIAGIVKLTDSGKLDTKTISSTKFSVGGLDSNGKYMNTNASIYTKEAFECQGLEVSLDFDNEIEYQIYFYDQNNDFVHTTGKLSGAFVKDSVPFFAKYARIVVTPKNDEVVSTLEVAKYAGQLTVKVNREQGFKNYTENLLDFCYADKYINKDGALTDNDSSVTSFTNVATCEYVNVSSYKEGLFFKDAPNSSWVQGSVLFFYDSNKEFISSARVDASSSVCFVSSENVSYYKIPKSSLPEGTQYIRMFWQNGEPYPEFFCR
ncbi:MAG: hypothetical protein ACI4SH_02445 [Candidatus Scatosoma sp.]